MSERAKKSKARALPDEAGEKAPQSKLYFDLAGLKSPPFSVEARVEIGSLLRQLQDGHGLENADWKPMTKSIGPGCGELRVRDGKIWWRVVFYMDAELLIVLHKFPKQTNETPDDVKALCKKRLRDFKTQ